MAKLIRSRTATARACRYGCAALVSLTLSTPLAAEQACRHLCQPEKGPMTPGVRPIQSMDDDLLYMSAEMARSSTMSYAERLANHYWLHESEVNEFGTSRSFNQWLRQGYHVFWRKDLHLLSRYSPEDEGFESKLFKTRFGHCRFRYSDNGITLNLRGYF